MPEIDFSSGAATGGAGGQTSAIAALLQNRNILQLLAGIGANLDPNGVGGAVGRPVGNYLAAEGAQETLASQEKERGQTNELLKEILLRLSGGQGFTSPELEGPTDLKLSGKGATLNFTLPSSTNPQSSTTAPAAPAPRTGGRTSSLNIGDVIPFS